MVKVSFLLKFLIQRRSEFLFPWRPGYLEGRLCSVSLPYIGPLRSSLCVLPFSPVGLVSITEYTFS